MGNIQIIDELGRIIITKDLRNELNIQLKSSLWLYIEEEQIIVSINEGSGIERKIDELARINIPKNMRTELGLEENDKVRIYIENHKLIIKKIKI